MLSLPRPQRFDARTRRNLARRSIRRNPGSTGYFHRYDPLRHLDGSQQIQRGPVAAYAIARPATAGAPEIGGWRRPSGDGALARRRLGVYISHRTRAHRRHSGGTGHSTGRGTSGRVPLGNRLALSLPARLSGRLLGVLQRASRSGTRQARVPAPRGQLTSSQCSWCTAPECRPIAHRPGGRSPGSGSAAICRDPPSAGCSATCRW